MNLLSSIKRQILYILGNNDSGIYQLSRKLEKSVSEVWRQMNQLRNLGIVKAIKKGEKYQIFSLNLSNPITVKLLELLNLMDLKDKIKNLEKTKNIMVTINEILQKYYISSINVLDQYSWDIPLELNVIRVISTNKEKEKLQLLQTLVNVEIRSTYLEDIDFNKRKFYKETYNFAKIEQAIIDALASNFIDEIDFAIQALFLVNLDFKLLAKLATSQYNGNTLHLIKYTFLFAKTFGLSFPISIFKAKTYELKDFFKNRVMQNFYRIYLGNGIAQRMKLY